MGKGSAAITAQASTDDQAIPATNIRVRKNGIEFRSEKQIEPWTEMTLDFFSPFHTRRLHCKGVVVACSGNRHEGYIIALLFTSISGTALQILTELHRPQIDN
jgi:hypothetical protein